MAADDLLDEVTDVLARRFWLSDDGVFAEGFQADWSQVSHYHMVEALLGAFDATGSKQFLDRADSVAERLIWQLTRNNEWRFAEHYTVDWVLDANYARDDPRNTYRPYGSVIGHAPEWARLVLGLRAARGNDSWYVGAAKALFDVSVPHHWADNGGLAYTVDFEGKVLDDDHYQWPISEAIGAARALRAVTADGVYEQWYRSFWGFANEHLIDRRHGGWRYVLDANNQPKEIPGAAEGKPDLYHALQSCLIPLLASESSVAQGVRDLADGDSW